MDSMNTELAAKPHTQLAQASEAFLQCNTHRTATDFQEGNIR